MNGVSFLDVFSALRVYSLQSLHVFRGAVKSQFATVLKECSCAKFCSELASAKISVAAAHKSAEAGQKVEVTASMKSTCFNDLLYDPRANVKGVKKGSAPLDNNGVVVIPTVCDQR